MSELTESALKAASNFLATLWREGRHTDALPPELRPRSRAEGYAIQSLIELHSAQPLRGWKIAATSAAGQRHLDVDGPLAGRLLAEKIVPMGEPVSLGTNRMLVAEIEFVFKMDRALPPRLAAYTQGEVAAAVAALHLGIEVPDSRYRDFIAVGSPQLIADNACADQFVLGPEVAAAWRRESLAAHRVQGRNSRGTVHDGSGTNVLGNPWSALTWLANELSRHGIVLGAGQIVTTGTCIVPMPIAPGDIITADYGAFGNMEVRFVP